MSQEIKWFVDLLDTMIDKKASDLYITCGAIPTLKINQKLEALDKPIISINNANDIFENYLSPNQKIQFNKDLELNFSMGLKDKGRFRINVFKQRNNIGFVIRYIHGNIPSMKNLGLPECCKEIAIAERGLVLCVGATGSGKSTSLASILNYRNHHKNGHIITIEDPIEYLHKHQKSIVSQREIGIDTLSYQSALKNALRQSPDVIFIGEIRTKDCMEQALTFAQTGHLCLATLHASDTVQTIERILHLYDEHQKNQVLLSLSHNLHSVIGQRLIPGIHQPLVLAVELLFNTPHISELIRQNKITELKEAIKENDINQRMNTFDQTICQLYENDKITMETALQYSDSKTNVKIQLKKKTNQNNSIPEVTSPTPKFKLENTDNNLDHLTNELLKNPLNNKKNPD